MKSFFKRIWTSIGSSTVSFVIIVLYVGLLIFSVVSLVSRNNHINVKSDQEKLSEIISDRFDDIDQFSFDGRALSLEEAETILYCWASGEDDISDEDLKEAIQVVLESTDMIRDLICGIDDIDLGQYD